MNTSGSGIHDDVYRMQAEICSALANPVRLKILDLLADREMTNAELAAALGISAPNLTQHLNVLKKAGILSSRKEGLYQYCSIGIPQIKSACSLLRDILIQKAEAEGALSSNLKKQISSISRKSRGSRRA